MKNKKILCIILAICFLFSSCGLFEKDKNSVVSEGVLTVKFIDVDQGDCELIVLPDKTVILIDGGDTFCSDHIAPYLKECGIEKIDHIVATHPHADHIGGLDDVLNEFEVGNIILPEISDRDTPTTVAYERFLSAIAGNGCEVTKAENGVMVYESEGISVECLGPLSGDYGDLNAYSAIVKLEYGEHSFMFMGDATEENEEELLSRGIDVSATVLKVGHHGSSTSSTAEFLDAVDPEYAVISVGIENRYGHPHSETIERLNDRDIETYKTFSNGTVVMECDGKNLDITTNSDKIY